MPNKCVTCQKLYIFLVDGINQLEQNKWKEAELVPSPFFPAVTLILEEPLGELDVICMCVFEEGCS